MSATPPRLIRVSAPVRLDFAGAWTDVAPFAERERGMVINAAIELRTHVELRTGTDRYALQSDDLAESISGATPEELTATGQLPLLVAAIRRYRLAPCAVRTWADAPPGSGLGTSGALSVALAQAAMIAGGDSRTAAEIAHEAWQLETVDAAVAGGQQDQFAAALGGFQCLTFDHASSGAERLRIDPAFADYLAAHTIVCYTGLSRFSGRTIMRVMQAYAHGDAAVVAALRGLVAVAHEMADALVGADLARVGRLLSRNWEHQRQLDGAMCTPAMATLEAAMGAAGAIGGKAAGAGAGGSMFFIIPGDMVAAAAAARACGAEVLPLRWAGGGVEFSASPAAGSPAPLLPFLHAHLRRPDRAPGDDR